MQNISEDTLWHQQQAAAAAASSKTRLLHAPPTPPPRRPRVLFVMRCADSPGPCIT